MTDEKQKQVDTSNLENENSEEKIISVKKVIYVEIDDEVTTIFDKIRPVKAPNIYIVVPKRASIFQSIVNLKILKRKIEAREQNLFLITNDKNGIYLAQQLGIIVYDGVSQEGKPSLFSTEEEDEKLRITPLKAAVNAVTDETPTRMAEKKISISELLKFRRGTKKMAVSRVSPTAQPKEKKEKSRFVLVAPNRHALISLIVVSVVILLVVIYIALPGVTVYLTPSASVLEQSVNITLADFQKNQSELSIRPPHMLASYPIEVTVNRTMTHTATGKKFSERGANASGKLMVINTSNNAWPLMAQTRFQTSEGIIFRVKDSITVPAATANGFGQIEVFVTADPQDAYGAIVGERGNIGPTKFFLPGLKESSRSELYAESTEEMKGGVTDYTTYVSEEDLEASRAKMHDALLKAAKEELTAKVAEQSSLSENAIFYSLLDGPDAIKTTEPIVTIDESLAGQEIGEFKVTGQITASGVYYAHDEMVNILESELLVKKSPQKELLRVNEDSTSYRIFEWDENGGKIKLTVNIKGIEQYEIDPEKENGARLLQKIREHIAGADIEDAKLYIQNLPEINKVEIDPWPMWSPTIPKLTDNIDFEIRDAMTVE